MPASLTAEAGDTIPFTIKVTSTSTASVSAGGVTIKPGQSRTLNLKDPGIWFGSTGQKCDYSATNVFYNHDGTSTTTKTSKKNVSASWWGSSAKSAKITLKVTNCYTPTKVTYNLSTTASGSLKVGIRGGTMGTVPRTVTYSNQRPAAYSLAVRTSRACKVKVTVNGRSYSSSTQKTSHSIAVPFSKTNSVLVHSCKA